MGKTIIRFVRLLVIIVLLLSKPGLSAETGKNELAPIPPFRIFSVRNSRGLPQSSVAALTQDNQGTLWIGTMDGLGKFDGNKIRTIPSPEGGPEFLVVNVLKPRLGGGIFVGGITGVFCFDGKNWLYLGLKKAVVSLIEEVNGRLWAVDSTGKIWTRQESDKPGLWVEKKVDHKSGKIISVDTTRHGTLVFAGEKGIFKLANGAPINLAVPVEPQDVITNQLITNQPATCWIGTKEGRLYYSTLKIGKWTRINSVREEDGRIESLASDRLGRIWVGHGEGSVNFGNQEIGWTCWKPDHGYLPGTGIMSIFADREGSVWFGLNGMGIRQLISEEWTHRNFWGSSFNRDSNLEAPGAAAFGINGTRDGGLFACYWGQGVLHWDGKGNLRTYGDKEGITENNRFALEPSPGVIWVCGRFTMFESRNKSRFKKVLQVPSGFVYRAQKSPEGDWYVNTSEHGIYIKKGDKWLFKESYNKKLPDLNVRGMTWLNNGELWCATMKGIAVFKGEEHIHAFQLDQGIAVPRAVNCILEREPGEVWAAGFGGIGIWKNQSWSMKTTRDGLPGKTIYSLARAKDGSVWAGGSNGIGHYTAEGKWKRYSIETGLLANECNLDGLHIDQDGDVWVGTMSSLSRFNSNVKRFPQPELRIYWRNEFESSGTGIRVLPRGRRSVKISWVAPWLSPRRVEYRTRILAANNKSDWTFQKNKTGIIIERLDQGSYKIQAQARLEGSGENGWTKPITTFVEIPPFWWETWWALALEILLGLGLVFLVVVFRTRYLRKRQLELKKSVDKAVAEIKLLTGLIPICAWCKKIRDDQGYWSQIEVYIKEHSEADFSHSICPDCATKVSKQDIHPRE